MSNQVLITGGTGYLGSVMVPYLEANKYSCTVVDTGFFKNNFLYPQPPIAANVIFKDVRDFNLTEIQKFSAVIHLAGVSNDPFGNLTPEQVYDPTRHYAKAVAQACKKYGVRFIFASSCSVYGQATSPVVNEDSVPNPQTPYSLNKLQVEQDLLAMSDSSFSPIMLRFATVYGLSPRLRLDLVVNMLTAMAISHGKLVLNSDGKALRPHLHILDLCESVKCALEVKLSSSPILTNIGRDDGNLSILDLAKLVSKLSNNCPIEFLNRDTPKDQEFSSLVADRKIQNGTDTRSYEVSFARVKQVLPAFKCTRDLTQGITEIRNKLLEIKFTKHEFENRAFYRLQTIEDLFAQGKIDPELRWK